jgi:Tfp pilus assembly major pilin PilA
LVTLTLSVLANVETSLSAEICAGSSYAFDGQALTESGTYTALYAAANGCDSLVTLTLSVLANVETSLSAEICAGSSYAFDGQALTEAGTYTALYAAANGCDSLVTLTLSVLANVETSLSAEICAGSSYAFDGQALTEAGTYTALYTSAAGCDSTVTLTLSVSDSLATNLSVDICSGDSYAFDGQALTEAGTYMALYTSVNGCDSIVTLNLAVTEVNTAVILNGSVLEAQASNAVYQWINCDGNAPIPGATAAAYTPTATGAYAVQITQQGCTVTSNCVEVMIVSSEGAPLPDVHWQLQPNPAQNHTAVVFATPTTTELNLGLYDATGRLLRRYVVASATERIAIDLSDLPSGVLWVRLAHETAAGAKRLVKIAY